MSAFSPAFSAEAQQITSPTAAPLARERGPNRALGRAGLRAGIRGLRRTGTPGGRTGLPMPRPEREPLQGRGFALTAARLCGVGP